MKIPKWLKLQEERDYWIFCLGEIHKRLKYRLAIEKMIDESTGYDKKLEKDARRIMKKVDKITKEYESIAPP
jgi:hypothetical protein